MTTYNRWAEAYIENENIVILLPISVLESALHQNPRDDSYYNVTIKDRVGFAKDVVRELNSEAEDGTTMIHDLFDMAMAEAIDNGSMSCEFAEK